MEAASIVIPAYNSEKTIGECLQAIHDLDWDGKLEVIVVNDGSKDRTAEIASGFHLVKVISTANGGTPRALNTGIRAARYEIVVTVDSDVVLPREWFQKIMPYFKEKNVAAAGGKIMTGNKKLLGRLEGYYSELRWDRVPTYTDHLSGTNTAYRRKTLIEVGLFDEEMIGDGDSDISRKLVAAGYRLAFCREAEVKHYWKDNLKSYFRQQYLAAYNRLILTKKFKKAHDQTARLGMIMQGPFTIAVILVAIIFSFISPLALLALLLLPLIHVPDTIAIFRKRKYWGTILLPFLFTLRNFIWLYAAMIWAYRELTRKWKNNQQKT